MTDIAETPAADGGLSLAPDQIAAMREQWASSGHDVAQFDAALAPEPDPADPDPAAAPRAVPSAGFDPAEARVNADTKTPALTPQQAQELAAEMIRCGVPADQVEAALKADEFEPPAPDTRTDEQKAYDDFFGPPPSPADYRVQYVNRIPAGADVTAVAKFNGLATEWAAAIGFPPGIGAGVIERALDVGQWVNRQSDPTLNLWRAEQRHELTRLAGGEEQAAERLAQARTALERAPAAFTGILQSQSVLDDAGMVMHLALQEERRAARG